MARARQAAPLSALDERFADVDTPFQLSTQSPVVAGPRLTRKGDMPGWLLAVKNAGVNPDFFRIETRGVSGVRERVRRVALISFRLLMHVSRYSLAN